jgi:hypothetical protein
MGDISVAKALASRCDVIDGAVQAMNTFLTSVVLGAKKSDWYGYQS